MDTTSHLLFGDTSVLEGRNQRFVATGENDTENCLVDLLEKLAI